MKWISVKDRFPPECENVIIYIKILKSIVVAYLIYDINRNPIIWHMFDHMGDGMDFSLDEVTHWMPLPEVPDGLD